VGINISLDGAVVRNGSWSLGASGIFGKGIHIISGAVGSGKSTLAALLIGLREPNEGSVRYEGISSKMISFQFPEYHITEKTLAAECRSWGYDPEPLLASVNLVERAQTSPLNLSRGELKRFHLACILAREYDLLILDEPFSSLDCLEKSRACSLISGRRAKITLIFTHEQSFFPDVDEIWEIQHGSLSHLGPPEVALPHWSHAPAVVKKLVSDGKPPKNLSCHHIMEAAWTMYE